MSVAAHYSNVTVLRSLPQNIFEVWHFHLMQGAENTMQHGQWSTDIRPHLAQCNQLSCCAKSYLHADVAKLPQKLYD